MPAQPGSAVLLDYGAQGLQQPGSAVLLSYEPPSSDVAIKIIREVKNPWVKTRGALTSTNVSYHKNERADTGVRNPWSLTANAQKEVFNHWRKVFLADTMDKSPWGKYGKWLYGVVGTEWASALPADAMRRSLWDAYGPMMNEDRFARWLTSKPADEMILGIFEKHSIPLWIEKPWTRPNGLLADFFVAGGSPIEVQFSASPAIMTLPIDAQFGVELYVPHFLGDPLRKLWIPAPQAVNFLIDTHASLIPALDEVGNRIYDKSARDIPRLNPWGISMVSDMEQWIPWTRYSRLLNSGWGIATPPGGPISSPQGTILVPVRSTYIVLNQVKLLTVPGGVELPVLSASLNIDNSSWVYGFNATLPAYSLSYVMASQLLTPVELDLVINGEEYRVLVEKVSRTREFGRAGITISGRGQLAYLSAPYSPVLNFTNTQLRTSQQLMEDALSTNGVSLGWTLDWQIPQWDIGANVWSFSGTYMEAALDIANSVQAYLLPSPKFKTIKVLSKYPDLTRIAGLPGVLEPTMPWAWNLANPGIVLPSSVVTVEGVEWVEKPAYNAVYVSGITTGIVGHVVRDGTTGDLVAPTVTNQLITHSNAAREAGKAVLGETGRMAIVTLKLPVLTEVGVIYPGTLVKYVDGATVMLGMSRSLALSSGRMEDLYQTIEIEVH